MRIHLRRIGITFAAVLVVVALLGDFISPNPPGAINLDRTYSPPTRIHLWDAQGKFHWRPFIYGYQLVDPLDSVYRENPDQIFPLHFLSRGYSYRFLGLIPSNRHLAECQKELFFYPLGADDLGRDVFSRVLAGSRTSLLVVLLGLAFYTVVGVSVGGLAGLRGGWADSLLMRISEFVLALPALYLLLALRALLPTRLAFAQTLALIVCTIGGVTWPPMARGVRGLILQLRNSAYVEAAQGLGGSRWQIMKRHLLPAVAPFALTQAAVAAPVFLLGEVVLSFLDAGFHESAESWGAMLRSLKDTRIFTDFWWNLAPLAMIFVTLLCLNGISERGARADPASRIARL